MNIRPHITDPESFRVAMPQLAEGEHYIGALGDQLGNRHHVILLPGENDAANWKAQMKWAERMGGDLKGEDAWCRQFKRRVRAHRAGTAPPRLDHTGPRPLTRGQRACAGPRRISLELTDTLELSHD